MSETMTAKDRVLDQITVYDIYGAYGTMKKVGNRFRMKCPFHEEKTPSFFVFSENLNFKCFGCGKSRSAFDFIMEKERLSFPESVKFLADKAGVDISEYSHTSPYKKLYEANSLAVDFYAEALQADEKAMEYLKKERGLSIASIEDFKLGYTPASSAVEYLKEKGITEDEIVRAGIGTMRRGKLQDLFWKRIIFPISRNGKVLGFGGRIIGDGEPKYINSPTTPLFLKRDLLYGFDPAAIRDAGYALVVEGYFDVIMCHQHGYKNAVAPLGTSLTEEQCEMLKKHTNWILLVLDGDKAGSSATERTTSMLFEKRVRGSVVLLPEGEDPDSYLRKGNSLSPLMERSIPFSAFLAERFRARKRMVFEVLINESSQAEMAEFLAHKGTKKEGDIFGELEARKFAEQVFKDAQMVYRFKGVEVRQRDSYLALFYRNRFLMFSQVNGDFKQQAVKMAKSILYPQKKAEMRKTVKNTCQ
jgi:DNA primase